MSGTQFDALQVILEPHIKNKTTNFCELSVQGSLWCFVLWDKVNLTQIFYSLVAILDFFFRFWLWIVRTPLKMFATDVKHFENRTRSNLFMTDERFRGVCKCDWHNVMSYLFFNKGKFQMKSLDSVCCAMSLTVFSQGIVRWQCLVMQIFDFENSIIAIKLAYILWF